MLWAVPNILVTKLDLPPTSVPELVALVKASPGKYFFGSGGSGTSPHLCGEMLKNRAGLDMQHVPYRGGAPAMQDMLAGLLDMMYDNISTPLAQYKAGKVKALAVTSPERHPAAPELPTMAEFYPGFNITSWGGLCGPAGLPPAMVEKAAALAKKALESESVKKAFIQQAATTNWMSPADMAAFRRKQEADLAPIIKASGARVD
jgi:tripartite-type tricarboxylate transporter receptor subunit TctC